MTTTWLHMMARLLQSDAPSVITDDAAWTGRDLMSHAASGAGFLDAIGAPVGAPVVALLSSTAHAFALAVGAAATDRALAPLGTRLTASELVPCVERLASEVIVTEPAFEPVAKAVGAQTGRRVAVLDTTALTSLGPPGTLRFDIAPDRPALILHTSGTTGLPKAVAYDQARLARRAQVITEVMMLGPGAVQAAASPFHHIAGAGQLFVGLAAGATLLALPRFDVEAWRGLGARGVTHAQLVPTMVQTLLDAGALHLPTLRVLQYGASPIHPDTLARAMEVLPGVKFVNLFGQTEGSPLTCLGPEDHVAAANGRTELLASVGRALPGVELHIDARGADGIGEVWARAAHVFKPDADGWLRTGDLGRVDGDGYLYLSGRKGDKIIRGGENVYPIEVEHVVSGHPSVADVCVYGAPDRKWGEVVAAAVVLSDPSGEIDVDGLRAFARQQLAGFKVPTAWRRVDELPRNMAGKVLRRELIRTHGGAPGEAG